ncbi:MAG: HPF/RaiA family ribosome-associated protein [Bacteroidia bacterium]|nr:HPF/RaiA family ribosome-associated protein [Bacteroidia bacterium]
MKITIQSIHFDADKKLIALIEERLGKLNQFFNHIISAEVYLRLDKDADAGNKIVEVKLDMSQKVETVKSRSKTFEKALDEVYNALEHIVKKHKEKLRNRKVDKSSLVIQD